MILKRLLLFSLSLLFFFGCHPPDYEEKVTSINIIDRNGMTETFSSPDRLKQFENVDFCTPQPYQKVLRIYNTDPQGNNKAIITSYYPNGQLRQYLDVVNNRAFGLYREWYPDGTLKVEVNVIGGTPDISTAAEKTWLFEGCCKAWDEQGCLAATILYNKGELEGESLHYHSNGVIWKRMFFSHNLLEGVSEVYLENEQLLQTTTYARGLKQGPSYRYWTPERPSSEEIYRDDLLLSGRYYDFKGELVACVVDGNGFKATFGKEDVAELQEFKDGLPEGEVKIYNARRELVKTYNLKNGLKHGEELTYSINPLGKALSVPRLSINWYEGKIQGTTKTWYENGILESQREMSNNQKNGLATAWYRDGSLMLIEEYDRDKLMKGKYFRQGEKYPVSEVYQGNGWATLFDADGHFVRKILYANSKPDENK